MKKYLFLIVALIVSVCGVWAQDWNNTGSLKISPAMQGGDFANGTTFYQIQSKKSGYLTSAAKSGDNLSFTASGISADAARWAIIGNAENGYQFVNKATKEAIGMNKFTITNEENCSNATSSYLTTDLSDENTHFAMVAHYKTNGYWVITAFDNHYYYWNQLSTLGYWYSGEGYEYGYYGWKKNNNGDDGASFKFNEVETLVVNEFTVNTPEGVTITYNGNTYSNGQTFTMKGVPSADAITVSPEAPAGYEYSVAVDGSALTITVTLGLKPVTTLDDVLPTKLYTISSYNRGSFVYAPAYSTTNLASSSRSGYGNLDANDPNFQFAFVKEGGKTYLWSKGAGKFAEYANPNVAITEGIPAAGITFRASTGSRKADYPVVITMDGTHDVNMSTDQHQGLLTTWNSTTDDGNMLRVVPVGDLSAEDLAAIDAIFHPANQATVTYVYMYNGSEIDRYESQQTIGATVAAPTAKAFMTLAYNEAATVAAGGTTVEVTCTVNLPFTVTTDKAHPVTGLFHMHSNQNYLAYMDTEANRGKWTKIADMPTDVPQQYYWYIMGNIVDGFQVYNLATGMPIMATEGEGYVASDDDATADVNNLWHIVAGLGGSKYNTNIFALKTDVNVTDKPYLNARSSGMGFWSEADNGSTFQFEPAEYAAPATHDYTVHFVGAPEGTTVLYDGSEYEEGEIITIDGTPAVGDFTAETIEGYNSSIAIDKDALTVTVTYTEAPHPHVIAYMKDLVAAATTATAVVSTEWNSTEVGGKVYEFNGSDQYIGAENEAVANAFKGDGIVTVAAWVYGNASTGCLFGNGEDGKGVKFYMSGSNFRTTTWGVADLTQQAVTGLQADQWNLVAFSFPGKASSVNSYRYYTTATGSNFWTKTLTNSQKMNTPASNNCAIGSGYGAQWKEGFNGLISNLVVIESPELLTNSEIAAFVGAQPTEAVAEKVDVTYNIYVDGTLVDTQVKQETPGASTKFTLSAPSYVTVTGIPATVEATTVDVYTTTDYSQLPFTAGADHYYTLKEKRSNPGLSIYVDPTDGESLKTVQGTTVNVENQNYFQWSFVGNWYTGYALLNKQTQSYVTYNSVNPTDNYHAVLTETPAEGAYFDLVQNGGENYLKIHGTTVNAYISNFGGAGTTYLTNWNSSSNIGDAGAKIAIEEAVQLTYADLYLAEVNAAYEELVNASQIPALYSAENIDSTSAAILGISYDENDQASVEQAISELEGVMDTFRATAEGKTVALLSKSSFNTRGGDFYLTDGNTTATVANRKDKVSAVATMQPSSVFTLVYDAEQKSYTVKNVFTENYLPSLNGIGGETLFTTVAEEQAGHYTFTAQGDEWNRVFVQNTESPVSGSRGGIHVAGDKRIVVWGADNLSSQWVLMPVSAEEYAALTKFDVTVGTVGYATLYFDYDLTIPAGVTAYTVEETDHETLRAEAITEGVVPANTGVVLEATANTYSFGLVADGGVEATSALTGVLVDTPVAAEFYDRVNVFSIVGGQVGFYQFANDGTLAAHKAFYVAPEASAVKGFSLEFGTEGIRNILGNQNVEGSFDLQGRRVAKSTKGLFIQNGKKVLVK